VSERSYFDHLAIGVERWAVGLPALVTELGGRWCRGGDAGAFAACQLAYRNGICLELIAPGSNGGGFMERFLERSGRGPHHLTFRVFGLDDILTAINAAGIESLDGAAWPRRREVLLHPKATEIGTLIQIIEVDDEAYAMSQSEPDGFPNPTREPASITWVGLTVSSTISARRLFVDAFNGVIEEHASDWLLVNWGSRRRLLVRQPGAYPGGRRIWPSESAGVAHVMLGPAHLRPSAPVLAAAGAVEAAGELGMPFWSVPLDADLV
jgi:methylmalonyl-CoA/ethylmalonyl-CoA epimerase